LNLHPLEVAVPPLLPKTRWAFTPPFHPFLRPKTQVVCFLLPCSSP